MKIIKVANTNISYDDWIVYSNDTRKWIRIGNDLGYFSMLKQNAKNKIGEICKSMGLSYLQMDLEDVLEKSVDQIEDLGEDVHEDAIELHQDLYQIRDKYKLSDGKFLVIWRFFSTLFGMFM